MAGTFVGGSLADGQVATSEGDLYAVPASTVAYPTSILFLNLNAAQQTLDLFLKRSGGTSRHVRRVTLNQFESYEWGYPGPMSAGDAIRAITTTTTAVNYEISGVLET